MPAPVKINANIQKKNHRQPYKKDAVKRKRRDAERNGNQEPRECSHGRRRRKDAHRKTDASGSQVPWREHHEGLYHFQNHIGLVLKLFCSVVPSSFLNCSPTMNRRSRVAQASLSTSSGGV